MANLRITNCGELMKRTDFSNSGWYITIGFGDVLSKLILIDVPTRTKLHVTLPLALPLEQIRFVLQIHSIENSLSLHLP
jgi:hypothetical protein